METQLESRWDWKNRTSNPQASINKLLREEDETGLDYAPSVNNGALWAKGDGSYLYLYGGTVNRTLLEASGGYNPEAHARVVWKYETRTKSWMSVQHKNEGAPIIRASHGASVAVRSVNKAYYLGGIIDSGSMESTATMRGARFLDGMLEFDMATETFRNISTAGLGAYARAYAEMVHIPGYGIGEEKKGILMVIGGDWKKSSVYVPHSSERRGDPVSPRCVLSSRNGNLGIDPFDRF